MQAMHRSRHVPLLVLLLLPLLPRALEAAARTPTVKTLTSSADFIFRGTVQRAGAANLSLVTPDPRTVLVRVEEVLQSGGTLEDQVGKVVTVFLSEPLPPGTRRIFFTNVQLLGESLGVRENGRVSGSPVLLTSQIRRAQAALAHQRVASRLAASDLAVKGRVVEVHPAVPPGSPAPVTEHDPLWWEAKIEIRSLLKGRLAEKTVSFWYPNSLDVLWASSPKPHVGDEGTWLLHARSRTGSATSGATPYFVADPSDQLSASETKVAASLRNP